MIFFKRIASSEETQRRFQGAIRVAMGLLDWLLPETEEVVNAKSQEDAEMHVQLPDELRDPLAVLDRDRLRVHGPISDSAFAAQHGSRASRPV